MRNTLANHPLAGRRLPQLALLAAVSTSVLLACAPPAEPGLRIAVARFQHETCTFCPSGDTEVEDWLQHRRAPVGAKHCSVPAPAAYMGGFVQRAREFGDVELVPLISPVGVFGGSSRSWNTKETFEHFLDAMLAELEAQLPVDGVYLALHGAMAVRDVPRPEAEIARRFRELVGPDVPIAGTFDLHWERGRGVPRARRLRLRDQAVPPLRLLYPGRAGRPRPPDHRAGRVRAHHRKPEARGHHRYRAAVDRPVPGDGHHGAGAPVGGARARHLRERLLRLSVVGRAGRGRHRPRHDERGDQELADHIADDMDDFIWRVREDFALGTYPRPEEGARIVAAAIAAGETPVAVGDHSDRPGDATHILNAFTAAGIGKTLYGTISSPATLETPGGDGRPAWRPLRPGDRRLHPLRLGSPTRITGTLEYFDEGFGLRPDRPSSPSGTATSSSSFPPTSRVLYPEEFRIGTINPEDYEVFVVKSRVHFRRGFDGNRLRAHHPDHRGARAVRGDHLPRRAAVRERRPQRVLSLRDAAEAALRPNGATPARPAGCTGGGCRGAGRGVTRRSCGRLPRPCRAPPPRR